MWGSITPLGERGRGQRWGVTASALLLGSVAGGGGLGGLAGTMGGLAGLRPAAALWVVALLGAAGALLDWPAFGPRLPTTRRQVNEDWLSRYRGWVYGVGFGVQLGAGLFTVVAASAVYVTFAAALLSGSAGWGAVIGGAFGLLRALPLVSVRSVRRVGQLVAVDRWLRSWDGRSRRAVLAAQVVLAVGAAALAWTVGS